MRKDEKSLTETHPEVAKQWHPTKNGDLTSNNVTSGSGKKVWWKCDKGDDHEWFTSPNSRHIRDGKFIGCPYCSNRMSSSTNNLSILFPKIANELHPSKNGNIVASNLLPGSHKKMWWKCDKGDDHVWSARIVKRTNGNGCPICSGRKVVKSNCLKTTHADVAKMWHPTKNGDLTTYDITSGSNKKVWWKCPKGDDHEWENSPNGIIKNTIKCKVCSNKIVVRSNCLKTTHPEIAKEWHPNKNKKLNPSNVVAGNNSKVWWKCDKGDDHEWITSISNRCFGGTNCPFCYGIKVGEKNNLKEKFPKLAKQWHPTKNGNLTPQEVYGGGGKRYWWKCDKGDDHEWNIDISSRVSFDTGCPICIGQITVPSTSLKFVNPAVAKQWHPTKNGNKTPLSYSPNSNKIVWWKCDKGDDHEWKSTISNRNLGNGCPYCTLTPQSKQELTITFELMKLFKNIDPKGLKTKLEGRLRAIDIYIPKLNLCIEFDGSYWHKDKRDIDKIKSEMLFEEGFKLIRVREEPLKKIYDTDVISKQPYNGKQVTNDILSMILYIFELDAKLVSKIKTYQSKDGLQNEKGLDKYIDKILTEKAEKK